MKTIKQQVHINAKPQEVYETYVDAKKHAELTGANVKFETPLLSAGQSFEGRAKVGGKFDIWGGELTGENVEFVEGKKIVQKWRANDWPEGHYSDLTITFEPEGGGTRTVLVQENVPEDKFDEIDDGWHQYYWEPMNKYFEKEN